MRHVQFTHPCSAQIPHDSVTRLRSAARARKTRTPALLAESPFSSAKALTGTPFTSMARSASAYSGFSVSASFVTHAQIGRFIWKYYDVQIGGRIETTRFRDENVTRGHAVIGLQGLVPYRYEIESELYISQDGDVSARIEASRDLLVTQKLVLQPRVESLLAGQQVERFTVGRGLNNIEVGVRLRYAFRREFAPYVGLSFDRSFFATADLIQAAGGDRTQVRVVFGVRAWH